MTGIDRARLAQAIQSVTDAERYDLQLWRECQRLGEDAAAEYDRLTAEWIEKVRSINLSSKATPTRRTTPPSPSTQGDPK